MVDVVYLLHLGQERGVLRLQRRLLVEHHHSEVGLLFELGVVARLPEMGLTQRVLQRLHLALHYGLVVGHELS